MSYFLYLVLIILNVADYKTTFIILSKGGVEKNPLVNWCIKRWGIKRGIIYIKAVPLIVMGFLVFLYPSAVKNSLIVIVFLYAWVVWHNYREVKKGK